MFYREEAFQISRGVLKQTEALTNGSKLREFPFLGMDSYQKKIISVHFELGHRRLWRGSLAEIQFNEDC